MTTTNTSNTQQQTTESNFLNETLRNLETNEVSQITQLYSAVKGTRYYAEESKIPNSELLPLYILAVEAGELKKTIESLIFSRLNSGENIKSLYLTTPQTTRGIKNTCAAYSALKEYISDEEIMSCCSVKIEPLERLFLSNYRTVDGDMITKEEGQKLFLEFLEGIVEFKTSKAKIVYKPEL